MEEEPRAVLRGTIRVYRYHAEIETEDGQQFVLSPNSNGFVHWVELIPDK